LHKKNIQTFWIKKQKQDRVFLDEYK